MTGSAFYAWQLKPVESVGYGRTLCNSRIWIMRLRRIHAKKLITVDVYGDNRNIILKEIPKLLSYMNNHSDEIPDAGIEAADHFL